MPAISTQDVTCMLYDGMSHTRERVEEVRRSLENHQSNNNDCRRSEQFSRLDQSQNSRNSSFISSSSGSTNDYGTPPPPYTPPRASAPSKSSVETTPVAEVFFF